MEITFNDIKNREIINTFDGKRLGRAVDIVFEKDNGQVLGLTVPGPIKLLRKRDDVFIPMSKIIKIGDDVILVSLSENDNITFVPNAKLNKSVDPSESNYVRFRRPKVKLK